MSVTKDEALREVAKAFQMNNTEAVRDDTFARFLFITIAAEIATRMSVIDSDFDRETFLRDCGVVNS